MAVVVTSGQLWVRKKPGQLPIILENIFGGEQQQEQEDEKTPAEKVLAWMKPLRILKRSHFLKDSQSCAICLQKFCLGEYLRTLPCQHKFHTHCLENWLKWVGVYCPVHRKTLILEHKEEEEDDEEDVDADEIGNREVSHRRSEENSTELVEDATKALQCVKLGVKSKSGIAQLLPWSNDINKRPSSGRSAKELTRSKEKNNFLKAKRPMSRPPTTYVKVKEASKRITPTIIISNEDDVIKPEPPELKLPDRPTGNRFICRRPPTSIEDLRHQPKLMEAPVQNETDSVSGQDADNSAKRVTAPFDEKESTDATSRESSGIKLRQKAVNDPALLDNYFRKLSRYKRKLEKLAQTTETNSTPVPDDQSTNTSTSNDYQFQKERYSYQYFEDFLKAGSKRIPKSVWILKRKTAYSVSRYSRYCKYPPR